MPEVTAFEMKRLMTIRENNLLLKELCGPGESVYELQNSAALVDAELAFRIGRTQSPTPTVDLSSDSAEGGTQLKSCVEVPGKNGEVTRTSVTELEEEVAKNILHCSTSCTNSTQVLRMLRKTDNLEEQSRRSSEEDGETIDGTDEDYVQGYSSIPSSVECAKSQTEEDEEEEYEDDEDDSDEEDIVKVRAPQKAALCDVAECIEEKIIVVNAVEVDDCVKKLATHGVVAATLLKKNQDNMTIGPSMERNLDKGGFETWETTKKNKRKQKTPKTTVEPMHADDTEVLLLNGPFPRQLPVADKAKSRTVTDEKCQKKRPKTKKSNASGGEGIVVLTEKEYERLLNLKNKFTETSSEKKSAHDGSLGKPLSEEPAFLIQRLEDESRLSLQARTSSVQKEIENGREKHYHDKGKGVVKSILSPAHESVDKKDSRQKQQRAQEATSDACNEHSSDSDFQQTPRRRVQSRHTKRLPRNKRQQHWFTEPYGSHEEDPVGYYSEDGGVDRREDTDEEAMEKEEYEVPTATTGRKGVFLKNDGTRKTSLPKNNALVKSTTFFPFEDALHRRVGLTSRLEGRSEFTADTNVDDDFMETPADVEDINKKIQKRQVTESEAKASRKRKQVEREVTVRKREAVGEKPFYIMVSSTGTPYGDGMTEWKSELNKLCRALDPSIRDVRHQSHHKIQILKKRLTDNFEYSGIVSDNFLMPLVGHSVSARRHELMNEIRRGRERPPTVNCDAWDRLVSISDSPNFQKKSEAMKYANSCRQNVGRTGPGGEIVVRDSLKRRLCRSPDPEEVQAEMTRDKGYGGIKKTKKMVVRERRVSITFTSDEEGNGRKSKSLDDFQAEDIGGTSGKQTLNSHVEARNETSAEEIDLLKKLQAEIAELKARVEGHVR